MDVELNRCDLHTSSMDDLNDDRSLPSFTNTTTTSGLTLLVLVLLLHAVDGGRDDGVLPVEDLALTQQHLIPYSRQPSSQ